MRSCYDANAYVFDVHDIRSSLHFLSWIVPALPDCKRLSVSDLCSLSPPALSVRVIIVVRLGWWTAGAFVCLCAVCMVVSSRCSSRISARLPWQLVSGWVGVGWHDVIELRHELLNWPIDSTASDQIQIFCLISPSLTNLHNSDYTTIQICTLI